MEKRQHLRPANASSLGYHTPMSAQRWQPHPQAIFCKCAKELTEVTLRFSAPSILRYIDLSGFVRIGTSPLLTSLGVGSDPHGATAWSVFTRKEIGNAALVSTVYARAGDRLCAVPFRAVGVSLLSLSGTAEPLATAVRL